MCLRHPLPPQAWNSFREASVFEVLYHHPNSWGNWGSVQEPARAHTASTQLNPSSSNFTAYVGVCVCCLAVSDSFVTSLPGPSVHGILQARILEWVANSFSRGSSRLRDRTQVSCIAGTFFTIWATRDIADTYQLPGTQVCLRLKLFPTTWM